MSETYYPPGGFYFNVQILGPSNPIGRPTALDASFQEASGIEAQFDVETVAEGGENRFKHRLPLSPKYPNLVLKRGIVTKDSFLALWAQETMISGLSIPIVTQRLIVTLLNDKSVPLVAWGFTNAWPIKWQVGPMGSLDNKVLVETFELSYNYFERVNLGDSQSANASLAALSARLR